jgi:glycosyltransferase involved in cell wall biosynthesis
MLPSENKVSTLTPLVSIIIPSYNSSILIERYLRLVLNTDYTDFEVIVVDDCSMDSNLKLVEDFSRRDARLKLVRKDNRSGPSATCNVGINVAKGMYIAFLETDVEIEPTWLKEIIKVLESDKSIRAAQSKVLDLHHRRRI